VCVRVSVCTYINVDTKEVAMMCSLLCMSIDECKSKCDFCIFPIPERKASKNSIDQTLLTMGVCMCVYMLHACMYACMHTHINTCIHIHVHSHTYTRTHAHTQTRTDTHRHTHIHTRTHTHALSLSLTHTCTQTHT